MNTFSIPAQGGQFFRYMDAADVLAGAVVLSGVPGATDPDSSDEQTALDIERRTGFGLLARI
jgi:hypothetical protein